MSKTFSKQLNQIIFLSRKNDPKTDSVLIRKAFSLASKAHEGQKRASGEDYVSHPLNTALILAQLGVDSKTIVASLLHDIVEDTQVKNDDIKREFGKDICLMVEGVTKFDLLSMHGKKTIELKNLQKIMLATVNDIRVLLIKFADKIHNIQTLKYLPLEKQKSIAEYALQVYAPLAHKLGIHEVKHEIENLCFPIVYPNFFKKYCKKIIAGQKSKEREMEKMIKSLKKEFKKHRKHYSFLKQHKSFYSIYQKMNENGKNWSQIYDFSVLIILTNSEEECYNALYWVHKLFYPLPMKFKDLIAEQLMPTYKSLHTVVIGPLGAPIKVYIRTKEMHKQVEHGIISCLNNPEKMRMFSSQRLNYWKIINAMKDREFSSALKSDFLKNTIFVFTKSGKTIELPVNSTPIDFAYSIKSDLGNKCLRVKVNGKIVPLWHPLEFGDKVELLTSKRLCVNPTWLDFVQTHLAKKQITKALKVNPELKNSNNCIETIELEITAIDRIGLLVDTTKIISSNGANILSSFGKTRKNKNLFVIKYVLETKKQNQLKEIVNNLKELDEIKTVKIKD